MAQKEIDRRRGRFPLSGLLMALFLAFTLSSGMVGFLLGRNAARSTGELMDTIVLSPGDSARRTQPSLHFLSGRLQDENGDPTPGFTVRRGSEARSDVTDEQGKFYLSDVRSGEQTLEVEDSGGNLLASARLVLDFDGEKELSADLSEDPLALHMPAETRLLEVTLTMEDETLNVEGDSVCFVTKDGQVVNFDGSALQVRENTQAVTPGGNLVNEAGYLLLPTEQTVISTQGEQIKIETGKEVLPGAVLLEDSSVALEQGPSLLPTGQVELPDGSSVGGGHKVVVIENGGAEELDSLPDVFTPVTPQQVPGDNTAGETAAGTEIQETDGQDEPEAGPGQEGPEPAPEPAEPTPEPWQGLSIVDEDGLSWQQESIIDLFRNRDGNGKTENGMLVAQPGDSGYYDFRLENPEEFDIVYTVSVQENTFHLPIRYSVVDMRDNNHYVYRDALDEGEPLVSPEIMIPAGTVQNFRIEWEWEYEDWFAPERDDAYDTAATGTNRIYAVSLRIRASQMPGTDIDFEGDTKYPGVHGNTEPIRDRLEDENQ